MTLRCSLSVGLRPLFGRMSHICITAAPEVPGAWHSHPMQPPPPTAGAGLCRWHLFLFRMLDSATWVRVCVTIHSADLTT